MCVGNPLAFETPPNHTTMIPTTNPTLKTEDVDSNMRVRLFDGINFSIVVEKNIS